MSKTTTSDYTSAISTSVSIWLCLCVAQTWTSSININLQCQRAFNVIFHSHYVDRLFCSLHFSNNCSALRILHPTANVQFFAIISTAFGEITTFKKSKEIRNDFLVRGIKITLNLSAANSPERFECVRFLSWMKFIIKTMLNWQQITSNADEIWPSVESNKIENNLEFSIFLFFVSSPQFAQGRLHFRAISF